MRASCVGSGQRMRPERPPLHVHCARQPRLRRCRRAV